jgi:hypothetical protein
MVAANPNAPFGLRPKRHYFGGVVRENEYAIADAYGTALLLGDPVVATGTGKNIQLATAGTGSKITGVFSGCKYRNLLGDTIWDAYWPAAQATYNSEGAVALVFDDPFIVFEVMFDTLAAGDVRALANLVSAAGDTTRKLSAWTAAHPPGAGENQIKIMSLPLSEMGPGAIPNNYGAFAVAEIMIAQHELNSIVGL